MEKCVSIRVEHRISQHMLDHAAVASEHGDEMLADMLTAEASALREGKLLDLVNLPGSGESRDGVACVETLRESAAFRAKRLEAVARAEHIIAECWLREGYRQPGS